MSTKKAVLLGMFLLLTWLAIMLFNIWIHELGHAIAFNLSDGWRNNIVSFGTTFLTDPTFMLEVVDQLQSSGLTPETFTVADEAQLLETLGQNLVPFRLGVIGGWSGQLIFTLIVFLLTRTRAFHEGASGYGRLFWHSYILINLAWMGGFWFLLGLLEPTSSDPIVLINVILQKNPVAIGGLWLVALGFFWLALRLAQDLGNGLFVTISLSPKASQKFARLWVTTTFLAGVLLKIPSTAIAVLLIMLVVLVVPIIYLWRLPLTENSDVAVPGIAWQGTFTILAVMLAMILTGSSLLAFGHDGNTQQLNALSIAYCQQTNCLPAEIQAWFSP